MCGTRYGLSVDSTSSEISPPCFRRRPCPGEGGSRGACPSLPRHASMVIRSGGSCRTPQQPSRTFLVIAFSSVLPLPCMSCYFGYLVTPDRLHPVLMEVLAHREWRLYRRGDKTEYNVRSRAGVPECRSMFPWGKTMLMIDEHSFLESGKNRWIHTSKSVPPDVGLIMSSDYQPVTHRCPLGKYQCRHVDRSPLDSRQEEVQPSSNRASLKGSTTFVDSSRHTLRIAFGVAQLGSVRHDQVWPYIGVSASRWGVAVLGGAWNGWLRETSAKMRQEFRGN